MTICGKAEGADVAMEFTLRRPCAGNVEALAAMGMPSWSAPPAGRIRWSA